MRVLIPLPDRDFDVTEVAVPWRILRDAGHQVVFAAEEAGTVPAGDPRLLAGVLFGQLGAAAPAKEDYQELTQAPEFATTAGWAGLEMAGFDGRTHHPQEPRHRDQRRPAFVVQDRNYLSARWPGDAYLFARRFCELLQSRPPASQ